MTIFAKSSHVIEFVTMLIFQNHFHFILKFIIGKNEPIMSQ